MTADGSGEPRRAGSLPPSSLPRPPRTLKTSSNSRYCRLSDTETRKKSDPGQSITDTSTATGGANNNGGGGAKTTRDSGNGSSIEYGRFDAATKTSRNKKKTSVDTFVTNSSLKKSAGSGMVSGDGHEYERLHVDTSNIRKKSSISDSNCMSESAVKHRDIQSRSFIPPPSSRTRIGEYGRLSDGESSSATVVKGGGNTLRIGTSGSSRGQSTGSTVSIKSGGRDSGASSEASTASLPAKARSIPRPGNYRIQF